MENNTVNHEIFSALMVESAEGSRTALKSLYETFLGHSFFIPERFQREKLSNQPLYPNDFLNILGIKDNDRVVVPAFSSKEGITEWFKEDLTFTLITGRELIDRIPKEWWIALNPQAEIFKELSPWEIDQIKGGEEGINQAVHDSIPSQVKDRYFTAVPATELIELKEILSGEATKAPAVKALYIIRQQEIVEDQPNPLNSVIIGIEGDEAAAATLESVKENFESIAKQKMIGNDPVSVVYGTSIDSLALGFFKETPPFYVASNRRKRSWFSLLNLTSFFLMSAYIFLFLQDLSPYWFDSKWTTDDALQQVYPFHEALVPGLFQGDLPTEVMRGYLAPIHYWLTYGLTLLTQDPIMASHWVMLIQILLSVTFLFLAVRSVASFIPAAFSVAWFLHTRPVIQRITGGLPRGWAAPVLCAFIYFALTGNHTAVLITIFFGCLLHPPATLTIGGAYGMFLLWKFFSNERATYKRHLIRFLIACPIFALITLIVISRPEHIGQMADFSTASNMPEFQWPNGRFPFIPLSDISFDFKAYAFQPFFSRLFDGNELVTFLIPYALVILFIYAAANPERKIIPSQLVFFLIAIVCSYFAARAFAFKLYVPNRHLQFPMTIFLIASVSIALWRIAISAFKKNREVKSALCFLPLAGLIYLSSGDGLVGSANFNYHAYRKGQAFTWIRENTSNASLFAGHPTHINGLPLFGARRAFATTEIAHPFYLNYYLEIKRRLIISLRAHYSLSANEFLDLIEPEKIDYFVFSRQRFYPNNLKNERYFSPLDILVKELTSRDPNSYFYKTLPTKVDHARYPYLVFRDNESAVVDVKELRKYLNSPRK